MVSVVRNLFACKEETSKTTGCRLCNVSGISIGRFYIVNLKKLWQKHHRKECEDFFLSTSAKEPREQSLQDTEARETPENLKREWLEAHNGLLFLPLGTQNIKQSASIQSI